MLRNNLFVGTTLAVALSTVCQTADAAFIAAQVKVPTQQVAGRWVWSVYLTFSESNDRLVSVNNFQLTSGTMANVQHRDYGSGTWNPAWNYNDSATWAQSDSWVSIDGNYLSSNENTTLSWGGGGAAIPNGAGWMQQLSNGGAAPYDDPNFPGTREIKVMQIAGTNLNPTGSHFSFAFNVDWRESTNSAIISTSSTVAIPAPGAIGMILAATGLGRTSRRRRR